MGLYENIKDIAQVVKKAGDIDLYSRILDAQEMAMNLQEENNKLKNEIEELKNNKSIGERLEFRNGAYFLKRENKQDDGPFCSACGDSNNNLIRLHIVQGTFEGHNKGRCPICKNWSNEF